MNRKPQTIIDAFQVLLKGKLGIQTLFMDRVSRRTRVRAHVRVHGRDRIRTHVCIGYCISGRAFRKVHSCHMYQCCKSYY